MKILEKRLHKSWVGAAAGAGSVYRLLSAAQMHWLLWVGPPLVSSSSL